MDIERKLEDKMGRTATVLTTLTLPCERDYFRIPYAMFIWQRFEYFIKIE